MRYMRKIDDSEVLLVSYYNVLFYIVFKVRLEGYKRDVLVGQINSGEKMMMKDIYRWCKRHQVPVMTKFIYRRDFSIVANIWNFYSYCRFKWEIKWE